MKKVKYLGDCRTIVNAENTEEVSALAQLINVAIKSAGLDVAEAGVVLFKKLKSASDATEATVVEAETIVTEPK